MKCNWWIIKQQQQKRKSFEVECLRLKWFGHGTLTISKDQRIGSNKKNSDSWIGLIELAFDDMTYISMCILLYERIEFRWTLVDRIGVMTLVYWFRSN